MCGRAGTLSRHGLRLGTGLLALAVLGSWPGSSMEMASEGCFSAVAPLPNPKLTVCGAPIRFQPPWRRFRGGEVHRAGVQQPPGRPEGTLLLGCCSGFPSTKLLALSDAADVNGDAGRASGACGGPQRLALGLNLSTTCDAVLAWGQGFPEPGLKHLLRLTNCILNFSRPWAQNLHFVWVVKPVYEE
jgi:hypothetical protein